MIWRPSSRQDLPLAGLWAVGALCAVASLPILPWLAHLAGPCLLRELASIPCLTCGATRAATELAHGHFEQALAFNPLAAVAIGGGILGGPLAPAWVLMRGPLPVWRPGRVTRCLLVAVLVANWIYLIGVGR